MVGYKTTSRIPKSKNDMWQICVLQYRLHTVDDLNATVNRNRNFSLSHIVQPDPWAVGGHTYPNLLVAGNILSRSAQNKKVKT
jgi:hypothetical protein